MLCVLLALWALISRVLMLGQWGRFEMARKQALTEPALTETALRLIGRAQRTWQVALGLKAGSILLLLWPAWQLGRLATQAQYKQRR